VIDLSAPQQYIRLERAFADEDISSLEIAKNADSLYYKNAVVKLVNAKTNQSWNFTEINGADFGLPRDENGIFATDPNVLYTINTNQLDLNFIDDYRLEVSVNDQELLSASTKIVEEPTQTSPSSSSAEITFKTDNFFNVAFRHTDNGVIGDVIVNINITELYEDNSVVNKTIVWPLERGTDKENIRIAGSDFYSVIGSTLEPVPGIRRFFDNLDLQIISGGQVISDYIRVSQANTGITSSGETPIYTNIDNGVGIFSSSNKSTVKYGLRQESLDSLRNGIYTKDLNFQ
jgi:hypothetical protein